MNGFSDQASNYCACKGIRTCLVCESGKVKTTPTSCLIGGTSTTRPSNTNSASNDPYEKEKQIYYYCQMCKNSYKDTATSAHPKHSVHSFPGFHGIHIFLDFISDAEEERLVQEIDKTEWVDSQSGRQKQDYGPKVNFKKKKLKTDTFTGLPHYAKPLFERMTKLEPLQDFLAVELCNLDYSPTRGAAIDPHFDDFWLWGERLVTVNFLSDTYLNMTNENFPGVEIWVPMPRKSLIVVYGPARNNWKHGIHRHHITSRRLGMTWRELTPEFLKGGAQEMLGSKLLDVALKFNGISVKTFEKENKNTECVE